jgi:hypothetical protein
LISDFIFLDKYGSIRTSILQLRREKMSEFENSDEKAYRSMNFIGIVNISLGIVMVVVSAVCGAFIIAGGAKLLKDKKGITF